MAKTIKEMLEAANAVVPVISPEDAFDLQKQGALIIDTREIEEVKKSGKVKGAHHVPRGLIEFQNKITNPNGIEGSSPDNTIILYCAAGGRAALAGKALNDLGFNSVFNLGGFKDWTSANLPIDKGD